MSSSLPVSVDPTVTGPAEPEVTERSGAGFELRDRRPSRGGFEALLPELTGALLLLSLEAMSVAFALWSVANFDLLDEHVRSNSVGRTVLGRLILLLLASAGVAVIAGGVWIWRRGLDRLPALRRTAWRLSPLLVVSVLPQLFYWRFWVDRHVVLLVLSAAAVIGLRATVFRAVAASQDGARDGLAELGAAIAASWRRLPDRFRQLLPTLVAWAAALWFAVYFAHHTIETHFRLGTSAYDLGLEDNLLWNLLYGDGPAFKSSPLGKDAVHFSFHATLFSFLMLPFYALYPHAETLLLLQAVIMGFGALPLYWFSRILIGAWPAALTALVYVLNAAVQGTILYDFHYSPLAPPFVFLTFYALQTRRDVLAAIAIALTLSIREDVAFAVVITGAYFFMWGRRPRAGLIVACVGLAYFVAMKFFIMPLFGHSETHIHVYKGLVPPGEQGYGGVLKTVLGNPTFTLNTLLLEKKLVYALQIFVPFAFLPLKRLVGWFFCVPGLLFTLLASGWDPPISLGFQYSTHWMFFFPAIAIILAWEQRPTHAFDALGRARKWAWLSAIALGTLIVSYQYGIVFQRNFAHAAFDRVGSGFSETDRQRLQTLREVIASLPPKAKIVASERVVPHLSNRPDAYRLSQGFYDAEYLVIDRVNLTREEQKVVATTFRTGRYGITLVRGDFAVAKLGAPTTRNAEWRKSSSPTPRPGP